MKISLNRVLKLAAKGYKFHGMLSQLRCTERELKQFLKRNNVIIEAATMKKRCNDFEIQKQPIGSFRRADIQLLPEEFQRLQEVRRNRNRMTATSKEDLDYVEIF